MKSARWTSSPGKSDVGCTSTRSIAQPPPTWCFQSVPNWRTTFACRFQCRDEYLHGIMSSCGVFGSS
jgi:hypothetical protein